MADPGQPANPARPVDREALRHALARLQASPAPPWLHGEVAARMAERLSLVKLQPATCIDWWSHLGASAERLRRAYPRARQIAVEPDEPRRQATRAAAAVPWWSPRRWSQSDHLVSTESEVVGGSAELLWANMMLHASADPLAQMQQWHAALAVDGFLMFSTLGPGSLQGLRRIYREQGWGSPFAAFVDMHDLGDMLVQAGFAGPVMDQEVVTLTWDTPAALRAELRSLGSNADPARYAGLRTPRWRDRLDRALAEAADSTGRVALEFEIVYGHAFKPAPRVALSPVTSIKLNDMRAMVRNREKR